MMLGWLSAVIDACPLCSMSCATYWCFDHNMCLLQDEHVFKWPIYAMGSKGYCLSIMFFNPKIAVVHWSDPKPYNEPFVHIAFPGFRL